MKSRCLSLLVAVLVCLASGLYTQTDAAQLNSNPGGIGPGIAVPRLIKLSGVLKTAAGTPLTGVHGLTVAIYKDQQHGAPIWLESQNVDLDEQGRYTVLLGATKSEGVPLEMFATDEPRWLGVQVQLPGYPEEGRVLLVSVPYALKAADAQTLNGLPLTSFVLTPEGARRSGTAFGPTTVTTLPVAAVTGTGNTNQLPKWLDTGGTLGDSAITDNGTNVGIGTTSPIAPLHVMVSGTIDPVLRIEGANITDGISLKVTHPNAVIGFALAGGPGHFFTTAVQHDALVFGAAGTNLLFGLGGTEHIRLAGSGNVGIGTSTPGHKLEVAGAVKTSGGIVFADSSTQTSAGISQTAGDARYAQLGSTITAVNAGTGLSGGGTSGAVTLSLTASCASAQILKWNGSAWACAADNGSAYSAGTGLSLAGSTFSVADAGISTAKIAAGAITDALISETANISASKINRATLDADLLDGIHASAFATSAGLASEATARTSADTTLQTAIDGKVSKTGDTLTANSAGSILAISNTSTSGATLSVDSQNSSADGIGVRGQATSAATSGIPVGVKGIAASTTGVAGLFDNTAGGKILSGLNNGVEKFRVDGTGTVRASAYQDLAGNPIGGGGTITEVNAGTGLTGGGTSGAITLSLLGSCAGGQILKWNGSAWACAADDAASYSAGTGLSLVSNIFSVADAGIGSTKIAGGAVSDTHISGTAAIAASKINRTGLDADLLDGVHASTFATAAGLTSEAVTRGSVDTTLQTAIDGKVSKAGDTMTANTAGSILAISNTSTSGATLAVDSQNSSADGIGVRGQATSAATSGIPVGVKGIAASTTGVAGLFDNTAGGKILSGLNNGVEKFRVDGTGTVRASAYQDLAGNPIGGAGTITAVNAGTGLTGGATSGPATLSLDTTFSDARYAQLSGANSFLGALSATTFTSTGAATGGNFSGTTTGVQGQSAGTGVLGQATAAGIGVSGTSSQGVGVYGENLSGLAASMWAFNRYGLAMQADSNSGLALRATGTTGGIVGNASGIGIGVKGTSTGGDYTSTGVEGSSMGIGVKGISTYDAGSYSVAGVFDHTAGGKILSGRASGTEKFSLDSAGNVTASGTFTGTKAIFGTPDSPYGTVYIRSTDTIPLGIIGIGNTAIDANSTAGNAAAILATTYGTNGIGLRVSATSASGSTIGVHSIVGSGGIAGVFNNQGGGTILQGRAGAEMFRVDGVGNVYANGYRDLATGNPIPAGTITGVTAGSGLAGGGTTGSVTLGLDTAFTDSRYALLGTTATTGANTFTALNTFAGAPTGAPVGSGSLFVNPGSAPAESTLIGAAVGGTEKFRVDAEGDVSGRSGFFSGLVAAALEGQGSTSGVTFGVKGNTSSTGGTGVRGDSTATSGSTFGVHGVNASDSGVGVFGFNNNLAGTGSPIGVKGGVMGSTGIAIFGQASNNNGNAIGVKAEVRASSGVAGVFDNLSIGGGDILLGRSGAITPTNVFRVDTAGSVYASAYKDLAGNPIGGGAATNLTCTACVSLSELDFTPATQTGLDTEAASRVTADTALLPKAGGTMTGTLNLPANGLVAGTNQLVLSGGKLGIGTASPLFDFHAVIPDAGIFRVEGPGNPEFRLRSTSGHALMYVDRNDTGGKAVFGLLNAGVGKWNLMLPDNTSGDAERMDIINASSVPVMTLKQSGNVGVGTPTPSQKLEVAGNLKISGGGSGLIFPDGSTQTTASATSTGDITAVNAGTGLTGGATSGAATLSLDTAYTDGRYARLGVDNTFTGALTATTVTSSGTATGANFLGTTTGVRGESAGKALVAWSTGPAGFGVHATASDGIAVYGENFSSTSPALYGYSHYNTGILAQADQGVGLRATGQQGGVVGTTTSQGIAVQGISTGDFVTTGVQGSAIGIGVKGISTGTVPSASIAGVFDHTAGGKILSGRASGTEVFSVASSGNVVSSGYLKGDKAFIGPLAIDDAQVSIGTSDRLGVAVRVSGVTGISVLSSGAGTFGVTAFGETGVKGTGTSVGVHGFTQASGGVAGLFDNTSGGTILRGLRFGNEEFRVDGDGYVYANGYRDLATGNPIGTGTMTAVNTPAGGGLQGGATSGEASLSLLTGCSAGQLLKWSGTAWGCANDADTNSGGTVTSVTAGTGLSGGTITGSGTLSVDTSVVATLSASNTFTGSTTLSGETTIGAGGIAANGAGLKHSRGALILPAGATGTTTLTWSTAFADDNYTATCQAQDATAGNPGLKVIRIQAITASNITVVVANDAGADRTGKLFCIAIHD